MTTADLFARTAAVRAAAVADNAAAVLFARMTDHAIGNAEYRAAFLKWVRFGKTTALRDLADPFGGWNSSLKMSQAVEGVELARLRAKRAAA